MNPLFEVKDVDRRFYDERLRDFLPAQMIDIHTHVWLERFKAVQPSEPVRAVTWPNRVAKDNSIEDLLETYRLMFPDKQVTPLIFGSSVCPDDDLEAGNTYVQECAARTHTPALIFSRPEWPAEELERRIISGGFLGAKAYLTLSEPYLPEKEIRIYDFFPPAHLEVLNRHSWIAMLHIPRDGRLKDPVNLAQLQEIDRRYPDMKVIVAHVGRAYCPEDVGDAFSVLARTERLLFDISANTNEDVFRQLIDAVGPRRILFGSDLPILRMRMRRTCVDGRYVNLVPKGLYGDVSNDSHMGELVGEEAAWLTFFMYEELDAFRRAAKTTGLTPADIEDVFYWNGARVFDAVGWRA